MQNAVESKEVDSGEQSVGDFLSHVVSLHASSFQERLRARSGDYRSQ